MQEKILTCFIFFLLNLLVYPSAESFALQVNLTENEQAWLAEHKKISIAFDGDYAPYSVRDDQGAFNGIAVDFAHEVARRAGLELTIYPSGVWKELYGAAQEHEVDVIATLVRRPERDEWFEFTRPYLSLAQYIITRKGMESISGRADVGGKTLALVEKYSTTRFILEEFPSITPYYVNSLTEALTAVSTGEADATVAAMGMAQHLIAQKGLTNMRFAALYAQGLSEQRFGVRKDWPELASILDKALATMTEKERLQIFQYWSRPEVARVEIFIEPATTFSLTDFEKAWLAEHPEIRVAINNAWPPMDFVDHAGVPQGIGVDFVQALNRRLDGRLTIVPGSWADIYEQVKTSQLDALMDITPREDRKPYFNFTKPYVHIPHVIIARKGGAYYSGLSDLSGKTIAVEKGFYLNTVLQEKYPDISIKNFDSTSDALDSVAKSEADVYAGNRAVVSYLIEKELLNTLQVQGKIKDTASINSIGVRKDWPELAAILDRALASLTQEEVRDIYKKWGGAGGDEDFALTSKEKSWLAKHKTLRLGIAPAWAPFEYIDQNNEHVGITSDYVKILNDRLGVAMAPVKGLTWDEMLERAGNGEIDVISAIVKSPERSKFLFFTKPYSTLPIVIISREDHPFIEGIGALKEETIVVVRGYITQQFLERDFPKQKLFLVDTAEEAMQAVSDGSADAMLDTIAAISIIKKKLSLNNIKVAAPTPYIIELSFAVSKDLPELVPLLDRALAAFTKQEKNVIKDKWVNPRFVEKTDWDVIIRWVVLVIVVSVLIIAVFLIWNRRLAREVAERKRAEAALKLDEERLGALLKLTQLNETAEKKVVAYALEECVRMSRSQLGFLHFVNWEENSLVLSAWSSDTHEFYGAIQKTHLQFDEAGVWAEAVLLGEPVVKNDYKEDLTGKKELPDGHVPLLRYLSVPVHDGEKIVMVVGVVNKEESYVESDVRQLSLFMQNVWQIVNEKRVEEKLQFTQFAVDRSSDAVFWIGPDGMFLYVNGAACQQLGYSKEELLEKSVLEIDPTVSMGMWPEIWQNIRDVGSLTVERRFQKKDGRIFPVEAAINFTEFNGKEIQCVFVRDISERKKYEEELQATKFTVDQAGDSIFWIRPDGTLTYANEKACRILGYTMEELLAKTVHDIAPEYPPTVWPELIKTIRERGAMILQSRYRTGKGAVFPVEVSVTLQELGGEECVVAVARDTTERKKAEEELRKNLDELERFSSMAIGREKMMIQLKKEINDLLAEQERSEKYKIVE